MCLAQINHFLLRRRWNPFGVRPSFIFVHVVVSPPFQVTNDRCLIKCFEAAGGVMIGELQEIATMCRELLVRGDSHETTNNKKARLVDDIVL